MITLDFKEDKKKFDNITNFIKGGGFLFFPVKKPEKRTVGKRD